MAENKLSAEDIDQFIDLYYNMKCLWDVKSKEYRDLNARNKAYSTIADILNISIEIVKKKINNLRSTYNQEKKKVAASQRTGAGTEGIYKPSLPWFFKMRFLDDVIAPRKSVCSYENSQISHASDSETREKESTVNSSETPKLAFSKQRRRPINNNITNKEFDAALKSFKEVCTAESTEFDKFGESIASQLKSMPLKHALELQLQLQEMVTKKRLKLLEEGNNSANGASIENEYRPFTSLRSSTNTSAALSTTTNSLEFPLSPRLPTVNERSNDFYGEEPSNDYFSEEQHYNDYHSENSNNAIYVAMRGAEIL